MPALALAFSQEDYDNGSVHMKIMNTKEVLTMLHRLDQYHDLTLAGYVGPHAQARRYEQQEVAILGQMGPRPRATSGWANCY